MAGPQQLATTVAQKKKKQANDGLLGQANSAPREDGKPGMTPLSTVPVTQPEPGSSEYTQLQLDRGGDAIAEDLQRRQQNALGSGLTSGMDLSGQFGPRGTTPSAAQQVAAIGAQNPGLGSGGFSPLGNPAARASGGAPVTANSLGMGFDPNKQGRAPSKVEQAAGQATDALGPAPQVDMGLAKTLQTQLALARSARGGPGAVQAALSQAQQQAPELQAAATEQARQEELSKLTAAGNVASNFAQAALGARGQDVNIAGQNVQAGLQVKDMVTRLTGTQLELDQRNTELIGQMSRDLAALQFDWASHSQQQASAALDRYLQIYQIDKNYAAQIKAIEAAGKISPKDILNGIIGVVGSAAGIGAAALK